MSNTFFTSDTHFHHKKILEYCPNRKGSTVEEMNELLIQAWNDKVRPEDTVYHLGDVSFGRHEETRDVLWRLNGTIHLILGNHDKSLVGGGNAFRFKTTQEYKTLKLDGKHIVLFHFPIESWDRQSYNSWHLHGHCHGQTSHRHKIVLNRMDIGIDTRCDMAPWNWEEIKELLDG